MLSQVEDRTSHFDCGYCGGCSEEMEKERVINRMHQSSYGVVCGECVPILVKVEKEVCEQRNRELVS